MVATKSNGCSSAALPELKGGEDEEEDEEEEKLIGHVRHHIPGEPFNEFGQRHGSKWIHRRSKKPSHEVRVDDDDTKPAHEEAHPSALRAESIIQLEIALPPCVVLIDH